MNWKFCALLLIIALLAFLCACNLQEAPQPLDELQTSASSTAPSEEPTASATEKSEPPTELPSDVTGQTEPYVIDDESFAVYNEKDQIYHYIGQGQTVTVKDGGLEIHVPEEWAGRVEVLRNACSDRVEIYIGNIQLMQTYADMNHDEIQESYGWLDWILRVQAIRKDDTATIEEFDQSAGTVEKLPEQQQSHRQEKPPRHQSPAEVHRQGPTQGLHRPHPAAALANKKHMLSTLFHQIS